VCGNIKFRVLEELLASAEGLFSMDLLLLSRLAKKLFASQEGLFSMDLL
jgi:hypothetical protein